MRLAISWYVAWVAMAVKKLRLMVLIDGFAENEEVHVDDVAMYRIE